MANKKKKEPKVERDENQMAFDVVAYAERLGRDPAAVSLGRRGGIARKRNLSKERLTEIGKMGANSRWRKQKKVDIAPHGDTR